MYSRYLKLCCQIILEIVLVVLVGSSLVHVYIHVLGLCHGLTLAAAKPSRTTHSVFLQWDGGENWKRKKEKTYGLR